MNEFQTIEEVMEAQERYLHEQDFNEWHRTSQKLREYRKAQLIENFPWVFWIHVTIRSDWFSYWWNTRGANFKEWQIWVFNVSVGRPWRKDVLRASIRDYGDLSNIRKTNRENLKNRFALMIGKYKLIG